MSSNEQVQFKYIKNLEWASDTENKKHGAQVRKLKRSNDSERRNITYTNRSKPVEQLDLNGNVLATYASSVEASKICNISVRVIWHAVKKDPIHQRIKPYK